MIEDSERGRDEFLYVGMPAKGLKRKWKGKKSLAGGQNREDTRRNKKWVWGHEEGRGVRSRKTARKKKSRPSQMEQGLNRSLAR